MAAIHHQHPAAAAAAAAAAAPTLSTEEQAYKQQWSKLIGLIEQQFMAKDIGTLDDEEEFARRKIPPHSSMKNANLQQQQPRTTKKNSPVIKYPKVIAIVYGLVSETIIRKDLTRAFENAAPIITNNEAKYYKIRERLQD